MHSYQRGLTAKAWPPKAPCPWSWLGNMEPVGGGLSSFTLLQMEVDPFDRESFDTTLLAVRCLKSNPHLPITASVCWASHWRLFSPSAELMKSGLHGPPDMPGSVQPGSTLQFLAATLHCWFQHWILSNNHWRPICSSSKDTVLKSFGGRSSSRSKIKRHEGDNSRVRSWVISCVINWFIYLLYIYIYICLMAMILFYDRILWPFSTYDFTISRQSTSTLCIQNRIVVRGHSAIMQVQLKPIDASPTRDLREQKCRILEMVQKAKESLYIKLFLLAAQGHYSKEQNNIQRPQNFDTEIFEFGTLRRSLPWKGLAWFRHHNLKAWTFLSIQQFEWSNYCLTIVR